MNVPVILKIRQLVNGQILEPGGPVFIPESFANHFIREGLAELAKPEGPTSPPPAPSSPPAKAPTPEPPAPRARKR